MTAIAGGAVAALVMVGGPAGAQTYTDGSGNDAGVVADPGSTTTTEGNTTTDGSGGGAPADSGDLGQVDGGELAFTGGDAVSLAVIGAAVVGAGGVLVASSRRNDDES